MSNNKQQIISNFINGAEISDYFDALVKQELDYGKVCCPVYDHR